MKLKSIIALSCAWLAASPVCHAQTVLGKTLKGDSLIIMNADQTITKVAFTPLDSMPQLHNTAKGVAKSSDADMTIFPTDCVDADMKQKRILLGLVKRRKGYVRPVRITRESQKQMFIPKGTWMVGAAASYQEYDAKNLNYLILQNAEGLGYTFNVSPYFGYFFSNNTSVGMRFAYDRTYIDLSNIDIKLGEDFNIGIKDMYLLEHKFLAASYLRNYLPLGKSKIFALFNEARLTYGYGVSKNISGKDADLVGTYSTSHNLQLGLSPGFMAFITDYAAMEIQVGVMGLNFKWSDEKINQVDKGSTRNSGANFKINLFSIAFGTSFYF